MVIEIINMKRPNNFLPGDKDKYEVLWPKSFIPSKSQTRDKDRKEKIIKQRGMRAIGLNSTK